MLRSCSILERLSEVASGWTKVACCGWNLPTIALKLYRDAPKLPNDEPEFHTLIEHWIRPTIHQIFLTQHRSCLALHRSCLPINWSCIPLHWNALPWHRSCKGAPKLPTANRSFLTLLQSSLTLHRTCLMMLRSCLTLLRFFPNNAPKLPTAAPKISRDGLEPCTKNSYPPKLQSRCPGEQLWYMTKQFWCQ
jgi:hypothetical protein